MSVNTTEILSVYDSMIGKMVATLDDQYDNERINSDMYGKALISVMQSTMALATQSVQQQPVLDGQVAKTDADTAFVETQDTELSNSVTFNNMIKALDSYSDMIGTMGAGSLVVSTDMWTKYFEMVQVLNSSGDIPASTTIDKLT